MSQKEKVNIEVELPAKKIHLEHLCCTNGHSLMDPQTKIHGFPSIRVKVRHQQNEGMLYLDPLYGSYDNIEKDYRIPEDAVVEFCCPECGVSLQEAGETCRLCASPLYIFHLPGGGIVEGCLKKGCYFHRMKIVDAEQQIARLFENDTLESYL